MIRVRPYLAPFAAVATIVVACSESRLYVYTAQKWNAADRCLDDYTPVETVEGDGADSTCPVACLSAFGELYVSSVCPPLPPNAIPVLSSDPECREALAAAARKQLCTGNATPDASQETSTDAPEDTGTVPDAAETGADADATTDADADAQGTD